MAAERFIAEGAGMTKADIFNMLKMSVDIVNEEALYDEDTIVRLILFKATDIGDGDAQKYVNDTEILRDEHIDSSEEEQNEVFMELGLDLVDVLNSRYAGKRGA